MFLTGPAGSEKSTAVKVAQQFCYDFCLVDQNTNTHKIPTLPETAQKVARLEKRKLDKKQYIAYEMIACTSLLGLVHDGIDPTHNLVFMPKTYYGKYCHSEHK
jgi:hypothetical protein